MCIQPKEPLVDWHFYKLWHFFMKFYSLPKNIVWYCNLYKNGAEVLLFFFFFFFFLIYHSCTYSFCVHPVHPFLSCDTNKSFDRHLEACFVMGPNRFCFVHICVACLFCVCVCVCVYAHMLSHVYICVRLWECVHVIFLTSNHLYLWNHCLFEKIGF